MKKHSRILRREILTQVYVVIWDIRYEPTNLVIRLTDDNSYGIRDQQIYNDSYIMKKYDLIIDKEITNRVCNKLS